MCLNLRNTTILIADDHTLVRETWVYVLNCQPGFEVVAQCGSGEEAVELAKDLHPDVILLDINLPGMSGIEAIEEILKYSPQSKILAVSLHTHPSYAHKAMQKGAAGYITKTSPYQEMIEAIKTIVQGDKYICQEIKNILSEGMLKGNENIYPLHTLSNREVEIVHLIKNGLSSKDIAKRLNITVKTVEVHRHNILKKLKMKNTAALVNYINKSEL